MAIRIRSAEPRECPDIRRVARQSWEVAYENILGSNGIESGLQMWYEPEQISNTIRDGITFVAIDDESVVGYTFGTVDDDSGELTALYVRPDCWGRGIGKQLLTRGLDGFSDRSVRSVYRSTEALIDSHRGRAAGELSTVPSTGITARVFAENERAVDFFTASGFEGTECETVPVTAETSAKMCSIENTRR